MMVRKDKVSMINIFDMMGPVMVGPSSSHTAGAARIGNMATARTARFWRDFSA